MVSSKFESDLLVSRYDQCVVYFIFALFLFFLVCVTLLRFVTNNSTHIVFAVGATKATSSIQIGIALFMNPDPINGPLPSSKGRFFAIADDQVRRPLKNLKQLWRIA